MTMDKSLRVRRGMVRARSVLTRAERIARLQETDRWQEGKSPLGLPKVRVYKLTMKKKKKKKEEEGEAAEAGAAAPAAGAAAAPAAAKPAAAGAKPAAAAKPAAKPAKK
jgi:small basic protein (TIGR04137 family)